MRQKIGKGSVLGIRPSPLNPLNALKRAFFVKWDKKGDNIFLRIFASPGIGVCYERKNDTKKI